MNTIKKIALLVLSVVAFAGSALAQDNGVIRTSKGWEFELKAGVNALGGTAPMPFPAEIRDIEQYNPKYGMSLEGVATRWLGERLDKAEWGLSAGLRLENQGMHSAARVKNYRTSVINEGNYIEGHWTGKVEMDYSSTQVSVPLLVHYRFNPDWKVRGGLFVGARLGGNFSGSVSDGYLRSGDPTGEKIVFGADQQATYDFRDEMSTMQWGAQVGGSWRAYKHFHVNMDLTWGFSDLFKKDFEAITFNMYPIFLQVGFGYQF